MTGNTVGSMRSTSNEVPVGRLGRILFTCDWHCSMAETMSSPQLKLTDISEVPRLVVDLTLRTPGMARTASSTGVVTSTVICSAGRSPASRVMRTRGKLTCGKSATGSETLAMAPASASAPSKNKIERAWLCAHAVKLIFLSQRPCHLPARNFLRSRPGRLHADRPRSLGFHLDFPRRFLLCASWPCYLLP